MTESEIQKDIVDLLKLKGAIVFRLNSGQRNKNVKLCPPGTPDILAVLQDKTLWIEVKGPKGKLRESQEAMIKDLTDKGQKVIVAYSVDDVLAVL